MPCGVGGVPTGAGLVDGGGRPRALVAGEVGGGVGAMAVPKRSKSREGVGLAVGGGARASVAGG